jgi:hypothetical protein
MDLPPNQLGPGWRRKAVNQVSRMNTGRNDGRSGIAMVADLAAQELRKAKYLEARPAFDKQDAFHKDREAAGARDEAARLLTPPSTLVGDPQTELVPAIRPGDQPPAVRLSMVNTLADPNTIAVDASEQRASVATLANVLSLALDAQGHRRRQELDREDAVPPDGRGT